MKAGYPSKVFSVVQILKPSIESDKINVRIRMLAIALIHGCVRQRPRALDAIEYAREWFHAVKG